MSLLQNNETSTREVDEQGTNMLECHLTDIKRFLSDSFLQATPVWLRDCVKYFITEHRNAGYTPNDLKGFVLEQWKLADLREMGQGCLPPNLVNINKTTLPGKYAVQVEWMKDVGQPAYPQLLNIREQMIDNTDVGIKKPQAWEPSQKRMLHFVFHDGKQAIKGMEYKPIKLEESLLPGFKAYIIGPVICRRGVVLLHQHNFQIIGGEIDSLITPNAMENILARSLNLPLNPNPYVIQPPTALPTKVPSQLIMQYQLHQNRYISSKPEDPKTNKVQTATWRQKENKSQINQRVPEEDLLKEDDLVLGDDMDVRLSLLEKQYQEEEKNVHRFVDTEYLDELEQKYLGEIQSTDLEDMETEHTNSETSLVQPEDRVVQNTSNQVNDASHLLDDDDDDLLCQMPIEVLENSLEEMYPTKPSRNNSKLNLKANYQNKKKDFSAGELNRAPVHKRKITNPVTQTNNAQSKITTFLNSRHDSEIASSSQSNKSLLKTRVIFEKNQSKEKNLISARKNSNSSLETATHNIKPIMTDLCPVVPSERNRTASAVSSVNETNFVREKKQLLPLEAEYISGFNNDIRTIKSEERNLMPADKESVSSFEILSCCQLPITTDALPFVYLNQIKLPVQSPTVVTVKGFVLTFLSLLTLDKEGWKLKVKICDGSANLDVRLSSDVLEKLTGFSPAEIQAIRKDIPKNPLLRDKMMKIFKNAQERLKDLNSLLTIEFMPNSEIPCVIDVEEITDSHLRILKTRVDSIHANLKRSNCQ